MADRRAGLRALLLAGLLAGLFARPLAAAGPAAPAIPASYQPVGENADFQLYAEPESLAFKLVDKRSGYVWNSGLDEAARGDRLNKTWRAFARGGLSLDYLDQKAVSKRVSLTNTPAQIDFQPVAQGFTAGVQFTDFGIGLALTVTLEAEGVRVEVPSASVQQTGDYKLGVLYVYPFLGAARADEVPGYMLLPDGAGTLIRFGAATKARNMFYGRYYGEDLGMLGSLPWDYDARPPYKLSLPVYGLVAGERQNAYLAIVEQGAAYGELQAHPAGLITNYNFLYSAFVYNESYFQATNRSGAGVTTLQPKANDVEIVIHYRFLTGPAADYIGLARSYQRYLLETGRLKPVAQAGSDIGIRLQFLGGEKERILFWDRLIPMTTVRQMADILGRLAIHNPDVVYYGWQPLGASAQPPASLQVEGGLGSLDQLRALARQVEAAGGHFYLHLDPLTALRDEPGYSPRNDLALAITDDNLKHYFHLQPSYLFNTAALNRRYAGLSGPVFNQLGAGLALEDLGSLLYSDYKAGQERTRAQAVQDVQALLAAHPGPTAFYQPNDYVFGALQAYYDMPITDSGYLYTSETVPFLPAVLAGVVPLYGPMLNFSSDLQADLLRHADYGVYPSFFLSQGETAQIITTNSSWIYTSSARQWGPEVERAYRWLDDLLGPVKGQAITARTVLQPGVTATTYANGQRIIVNYTDQPYAAGAVVVAARQAIRQEAQP